MLSFISQTVSFIVLPSKIPLNQAERFAGHLSVTFSNFRQLNYMVDVRVRLWSE